MLDTNWDLDDKELARWHRKSKYSANRGHNMSKEMQIVLAIFDREERP